MPIDFPNSPSTNQQYIYNGTVWQWNGYAWIVVGTNAGIGNYVTTFNGLTGAVTGLTTGSVGGTVGSIQFKSSAGLCGSEYFTVSEENPALGPTQILLISGPTSGTQPYYTGDTEAVGIEFNRSYQSFAFDESGGIVIRSRGKYFDGGATYGANMYFSTPAAVDSGSACIFKPQDQDGLYVSNVLAVIYVPFTSSYGYRISSNAINAQTGTTYTIQSTDNGKIITSNNGSSVTITIPAGMEEGFNTTVIQLGAGQVGFTAASGVILNSYSSAFKIAGQHGSASILSYASNIYNISGSLNP